MISNDDRLDRIEQKLDKVIEEQGNKLASQAQDIVWIKGSVKLIVTTVIGSVSGLIMWLINSGK